MIEADLILHVRDIAHAETEAQRADVNAVLADLGIRAEASDTRVVEVWNKIDLLTSDQREEALWTAGRAENIPALVSAVTGEGMPELLALIDAQFSVHDELIELRVPAADGAVLAWLHENAQVLGHATDDQGVTHAKVRIARARHGRLVGRLKGTGVKFSSPA